MPLVASAAVEVEQPERAQRVGTGLEQVQRVVLEPARPHLGTERAGLEVARQVHAERRRGGVRRVGRRHGEDVQGQHVVVALLALRLEGLEPLLEPARLLDQAAELRHVAPVAVVEAQVAAVAGERAEDLRAPHAQHERAVAARGLAYHAAMVARGERAEASVHVRHQLLDQMGRVAAGGARVEVLRSAVAGEAVGHHQDHLAAGAARDERVHAVVERGRPRVVVEQHAPAPGESGEHEAHRVAPPGGVRVGRRQVDRHRAHVGVAGRVARERGALEPLHHHLSPLHRLFLPGPVSRSQPPGRRRHDRARCPFPQPGQGPRAAGRTRLSRLSSPMAPRGLHPAVHSGLNSAPLGPITVATPEAPTPRPRQGVPDPCSLTSPGP